MKLKKLAVLIAATGLSSSAFATNGYFAHGIGIKAKAMGGAGIAYAEDGFGAATNPATLSRVPQGWAIGGSLFVPDRASSLRGGTGGGGDIPGGRGWQSANHQGPFLIPEFAYARHGSSGLSYGITVYGNGGMNVDYGKAIYDQNGDKTFASLEQLFIAPTIAKKLNDQHTIAASLNLVYQTFEAGGLDMFTQYTRGATLTYPAGNSGIAGNPFGYTGGGSDPGNRGKDKSTGIGLRLGWTGQLSESLSVGAFLQPKTSMSRFDRYRNLFAQNGRFDIPATYGLGFAFSPTADTTVLFDVVQIDYSKIRSLGNKNNHVASNTQLGADDGKGFGWSDMTVFKLGVRHQWDAKTVVRAGWNYAKQPIAKDQLDFNLLAPAVVEHHLTLGATRKIDGNSEVSFHYMHAFEKKIEGPMVNGTGTIHVDKLRMNQNELGIQYSAKF